jgi:amyloid beta precursor protein binding protein 1
MHDLKSRVRSLLVDWHTDKLIDAIPDAAIDEICRYGASEPHSIAALTGGIVAHETVKLITRHYIPVDNTFIVDGHTLSAQSFQL